MPEVSILVKAKDEASKVLKGIGKGFSDFGIVAPLSIGAVGLALTKFAVDAAAVDEVRNSFNALAEDAGRSGDKFIGELQKMTGGMVSEANLMKMTNQALIVSGSDVADRLPTYFAISRAAAEATGGSFEEMFQKLTMGIEAGSNRMLRQLGLTIDADEAYQGYAKSIGKSAEALTDLEKKTAIENAVMANADDMLKRLGSTTGTTDDKIDQFTTRVADLKLEIGTRLLPVLDDAVTMLLSIAEASKGVSEETKEIIYKTIDATDTQEEYAQAIIDSWEANTWYEKIIKDVETALNREWLEQQQATMIIQRATEAEEAADTARRDAVKGIYAAAEALKEQGKAAEMSAEDYEKLKDATKGLIGAMEELMFPDEAQAREVSDLFYQMYVTENPRVIAAAQGLEAERTSGTESLGIAQETADGVRDIYEDAQTRLEETRAGMHGVPGAYDVLAITSEAVAPYKSEWKNAQDEVERLEGEHLGRLAGLEAGYAATVSTAKKNIPAEWTSYLAEVEEAERIAAKARATAITDALREQQPDQYDVLAQMVRDGDVILSELPGMTRIHTEEAGVEFNKLALGVDEDITWANVRVAMKASEMKKSLVDDAFEPARKSVKDFRAEIDALDGTKVNVYIHEWYIEHRVEATAPTAPH